MTWRLWMRPMPWRVSWAAWQFGRSRAEYYDFLAQLLRQDRSDQTLLDIFRQDSLRYGQWGARGVLAQWWLVQYPASGGDLAQTWKGTLPESDIQCVSLAQDAGQQALVDTLSALARQIRVLQVCLRDFWQTVAVGIAAAIVALLVLLILPLYSAPTLVASFSVVGPDLYGASTRQLVQWSLFVSTYGWLFALAVGLAIWAFLSSFPRLTGRWRKTLDQIGPWRLYRDMQSMRFLVMTATLLSALEQRGVSLRAVLQTQINGSTPWMGSHLACMVHAIDQGLAPLEAMNTGLFNRQAWWQLIDLARIAGLSEALRQSSTHICDALAESVKRRAVVIRWVLLSASIGGVLFVGTWHAQVIEEMRRALMVVYGA
jgi:type II secretory pathway component PulF